MVTLQAKKLGILKKTIGLLGTSSPRIVFLKTRFGIHTFGMQFPIDVLILTSENEVVKRKENLQKNNLFFWNPIYNKVLELPKGTIAKKKILIGDFIHLVLD